MYDPGGLSSFLLLALLIMGWRWWRTVRKRSPFGGTLPDVGDAPSDAEPMFRPQLDDNGLATFSSLLPSGGPAPHEPDESASSRSRHGTHPRDRIGHELP